MDLRQTAANALSYQLGRAPKLRPPKRRQRGSGPPSANVQAAPGPAAARGWTTHGRADGAGGRSVVAPDWQLHPRGDRPVPPCGGLYRPRAYTGVSSRRRQRFFLKPVAAINDSSSNPR